MKRFWPSINLTATLLVTGLMAEPAAALTEYNKLSISDSAIASRLEALEKGLNMLQKYTYNLNTNSLATQGGAWGVSAEGASGNIEEITEQFRSVHNDIEKLQYAISRLNDRLMQFASDFEQRLSDIENPIKEEKEAKKVVNKVESELEEIYIPKPQAVDAPAAEEVVKAVTSTLEDEFKTAYGFLKNKNYSKAQDAFENFIKAHPTSHLIGVARYWLGEIYMLSKSYDKAAVEYLKGYQSYPTGSRAPDNLFRLGETLIKLDKRQEACATFMKMVKEFPKMQLSLKRQVEKTMKSISCAQ